MDDQYTVDCVTIAHVGGDVISVAVTGRVPGQSEWDDSVVAARGLLDKREALRLSSLLRLMADDLPDLD